MLQFMQTGSDLLGWFWRWLVQAGSYLDISRQLTDSTEPYIQWAEKDFLGVWRVLPNSFRCHPSEPVPQDVLTTELDHSDAHPPKSRVSFQSI